MGGHPAGTDNVKHPTDLQRRLVAQVAAGLDRTGKKRADLARDTGLKAPYVSQMLSFERQGTIASWDLLLRAVGVVGYKPDDGAPMVPGPLAPRSPRSHIVLTDQVESVTLSDGSPSPRQPVFPPAPFSDELPPVDHQPWPPPPPLQPPSRPRPTVEPDVSSDEDFAPRTRK